MLQLVCQGTHLAAVIDFASASWMPLAWDLMRSSSDLDPAGKAGAMDISFLTRYISNDLDEVPGLLTLEDLQQMASIYFLQLLRSACGYREALKKDDQRDQARVTFAVYRTHLCRWLNQHLPDVQGALSLLHGD